jgi:hypothetical protein
MTTYYKPYRTIQNGNEQDQGSIAATENNKFAGAKKVMEVGRRLKPLLYVSGGAVTGTTNATTTRVVLPGQNLAIYNSDTAIHSITLGTSSPVTSLAPGVVTGTNPNFNVGVPLEPGAWTYLPVGTTPFLITDSALVYVFLIEDDTIISQEYFQVVPIVPNVDPS